MQEALRVLVEVRRHRLFTIPDASRLAPLCTKHGMDLVVANLEPDGYAVAAGLRASLGSEAPPVILMSTAAELPREQEGVARIVSMRLDPALVDLLEAVSDSA